MKKFWSFARNDVGERILRLEGPIDEDNFWGDEITPAQFRQELEAEEGDVTVWINSPGGNVFAAAQIYTMLCEHKGAVTVKIDAIAASAASVIAMAGDRVLMSPVAMLMIHDPSTIAVGNAKDMEKAISTLNEVKESIINAYAKKTGLSRNKIAKLMSDETWMNAKKAVELGFADEVLFSDKTQEKTEGENADAKEIEAIWQPYSTKAMGQRVLNWLVPTAGNGYEGKEHTETAEQPEAVEQTETGVTEEETTAPIDTVQAETQPTTEPQQAEPTEEEVPLVEDVKPAVPIIGMDGKTQDGSMPYELLKKQLDFLK